MTNSIDPMYYREDGDSYLFWGSFHGIYGVPLADDGLSHRGADRKFQVAGGGFEAPHPVKRDGRYYLFVSAGACCEGAASTYHVLVGRAESLGGPYVGANGEELLDGDATLVLERGNGFVGPGHNAVVRDDGGTDWTPYHAYEETEACLERDGYRTLRRTLMLDPLTWADGWPTVEGRQPSQHEDLPEVA